MGAGLHSFILSLPIPFPRRGVRVVKEAVQ